MNQLHIPQNYPRRILKRFLPARPGRRGANRRRAALAGVFVVAVGTFAGLYSDVAQAAIALRSTGTASISELITLRAASTSNNAGGSTALTIGMPTGTVEDDIMVAALTIRGGTGTTITTVPTDWTLLDIKRNSTTVLTQVMYWKKAAAGESGSYTWNFTSNKASGVLLSYANVDPTSPIGTSSGQVNASSGTYTAPSVSTTVSNEMLVGFFGVATGTTISSATMTIRGQDASTGAGAGSRTTTAGADLIIPSAGATGAKTATGGAAVNVGQVVTLKPSPRTSLKMAKPAGAVQSDLLLAAITITGNTSITPPSGWTSTQRNVTASNEIATEIWYKVAGGSEPSSYTWSWTGAQQASGAIAAYSGVDSASPVNTDGGQANTSGTTITAPAVSPTALGTMLVGVFGIANTGTITADSPLTGRAYASATGTSASTGTRLADQSLSASGSTGTRTATAGTAGVNIGQLVALNPAVATLSQGSHRWFGQPEQAAGMNWINHATAAAANSWQSITYGNGLFVAVSSSGTGNRVMTSPDGITWTARTSAADNDWRSVTYGNGIFVAVSDTGTGDRVMTSPDGITWTSQTSAANNSWLSVTFGEGLFVAVSITGTGNRVMTSPDGITWTSRTSAADNSWNGVTYGNGMFVAVGSVGTGNRVMTSPDGITWTSRTSAADNGWRSVTYGNGLFVAIADSGTGDRVMTSPDGITWTSRTSAADNSWRSVAYGSGLFVAVSSTGTGNRVMTSPDGITWTSRTGAADDGWFAVSFGAGRFVAVPGSGTSRLVAISDASVIPTATTWTSRTSTGDDIWSGVIYGSGLFVAVSGSGTVMTSPDGITWTSRTAATSSSWLSVTYGNGLFVAVANTGTGDRVMTSPDGTNWVTRTSAADNSWTSIAYGNGVFAGVAITGTGNRVMTSSPAILWGENVQNNYGTVTSSGSDPTQGGADIVRQNYITNNYFTNSFDTPVDDYGQFDFDLDMSKASYQSTYCFRIVAADGTTLSSYSTYPEITRCTVPSLDVRLRHSTAFCVGSKRFYWNRAGN